MFCYVLLGDRGGNGTGRDGTHRDGGQRTDDRDGDCDSDSGRKIRDACGIAIKSYKKLYKTYKTAINKL